MFIETMVNHNKFGSGKIVDFEINPVNQLKSKITVEFESGKKARFLIDTFDDNGFLTTDNESIISYVKTLGEEENEKKKKELEEKAKEHTYIPSYNLDEVEMEVKKEDWERAYKVAESYRFPNESRAVVMDSDLVFINASAAMRYLNSRVKDCDKIYKACESNKKFLGCHWTYATRESIKHIIDSFNESEE